jgi:hypothetical protein
MNERNSRKMMNTKKCYIKRKNSEWQEGRAHHEKALKLYLTTYVEPFGPSAERAENNDPYPLGEEPGVMPPTVLIYTEHEDGGIFMAKFSRVNEHFYQFVDEYDNIVCIMMADLSFVDYINRITN